MMFSHSRQNIKRLILPVIFLYNGLTSKPGYTGSNSEKIHVTIETELIPSSITHRLPRSPTCPNSMPAPRQSNLAMAIISATDTTGDHFPHGKISGFPIAVVDFRVSQLGTSFTSHPNTLPWVSGPSIPQLHHWHQCSKVFLCSKRHWNEGCTLHDRI